MFTTDELNARFRLDVADPLEGVDDDHPDSECLWSNDEIYAYMTEAADAVARDTKGLYKLYELAVTAGESKVVLPRPLLELRLARLVNQNRIVFDANQNEIAYGTYVCDYGHWFTSAAFNVNGVPGAFARDRIKKVLVFDRIPTKNDTLECQAIVTIATPLLCGMPLPFLERPDIRLMLLYMKHLAYAKQDADTLDLSRSDNFLERYKSEASEREVVLRRQRRKPSVIRMEGW